MFCKQIDKLLTWSCSTFLLLFVQLALTLVLTWAPIVLLSHAARVTWRSGPELFILTFWFWWLKTLVQYCTVELNFWCGIQVKVCVSLMRQSQICTCDEPPIIAASRVLAPPLLCHIPCLGGAVYVLLAGFSAPSSINSNVCCQMSPTGNMQLCSVYVLSLKRAHTQVKGEKTA